MSFDGSAFVEGSIPLLILFGYDKPELGPDIKSTTLIVTP
jgi:hypothetical protein